MKNSPILRLRNIVVAFVLLGSLFLTQANAQDSLARWTNFDFAKSSLRPSDLTRVSLYDLKLMRGIVFGRHGRVFKDAEIRAYLEDQSWFKPNQAFRNSMLNETERRNLDVIRIAEASKHPTVQPGDMRYWQTRPLTVRKLGTHSGAEWLVLRSEVDRKSTRLNSSHVVTSRMPSSA